MHRILPQFMTFPVSSKHYDCVLQIQATEPYFYWLINNEKCFTEATLLLMRAEAEIRFSRFFEHGPEVDGWGLHSSDEEKKFQLCCKLVDLPDPYLD